MSDHDQLAAVRHFLAGARAAGLRSIVLSPGSRSTPLALAASDTADLTWHLHLDERSAAFAALGEAKASRAPVGLVCTSGTAAANYAPAVSEAFESNVPLVVITADRPPEHIHWGVGQSFDQRELFSGQLCERLLMPTGADGGLEHALRSGARATHRARTAPGPIHVNWPFRLPLEPSDTPPPNPPRLEMPDPERRALSSAAVQRLAGLIGDAGRPLLVAGPETPDPAAVVAAATALGLPIVADVLSGVRAVPGAPLVDAGELLAESGAFEAVDLLIRVGDTPTAKALRLWWESNDVAQVLLDPLHRWHDPSHAAVAYLDAPVGDLLAAVVQAVGDRDDEWAAGLTEQGASRRAQVDEVLLRTTPGEAHVADALGRAASTAQAVVVAASSMPVRDADLFFPLHSPAPTLANRGINGIDGIVATSIGVSRAHAGRPVIAYLGDVALLHDIGSVLDAKRQGVDLTIVVPNNDGGGIFSFLPIRAAIEPHRFDELFHTPHGMSFDFLAGAGVDYRRVAPGDLEAVLAEPVAGVRLVEVPVATDAHLDLYRTVRALR